MSRHSIKELTTTLHVSRGRVYQIINNLKDDEKVRKDRNGNYILDDKAVDNIRSYFEANTMKDDHRSINEQRVKLSEQVNDLKRKNAEYERQVDSLKKLIAEQEDHIKSLKQDNQTFKEQLNVKDNQIQKVNQLADQAQKLNAVDKQKEIEHNGDKKSFIDKVTDFFSGKDSQNDKE